jgi:hypothetical protein
VQGIKKHGTLFYIALTQLCGTPDDILQILVNGIAK